MAIELHPLDQFKIEPIIPIHIGGIDASFTNSALFMVITIALASVVVILGLARPRAGAQPLAVAGRDVLRIHRRHDRRQCRA